MLDSEKLIKSKMGEAKEKTYIKNTYTYKDLSYDGIKFTLKEDYDKFSLVKVEITSKKYKTSRKIKVGNKISKVLKKYNVTNKEGNYTYGNYSKESLSDDAITKNIYFGYRTKNEVYYINKDNKIENMPTLTSSIHYYYKNGKVTKIVWSYDL